MAENSGANGRSEGDGNQKPSPDFDARLYHLVFGVMLTLIASAAEFKFLWSEGHGFSLLFIAATISALAVYEVLVVYRLHVGYLLAVIFVVGCATVSTYQYVGPELPDETEIHGWLIAANERTPHTGCKAPIKNRDLLMVAGTTGIVGVGNGPFIPVTVGKCNIVTLERGPNGLMIDADAFDISGNLIYRIEQNEFHLVQGEYSYSKRPDRSTLVVFDRKGRRQLSVYYLNKNTVRISGIFTCGDGHSAEITDDGVIDGFSDPGGCLATLRYGISID